MEYQSLINDDIEDFQKILRMIKQNIFIFSNCLVLGIVSSVLFIIVSPKVYQSSILVRSALIQNTPVEENSDTIRILSRPEYLINYAQQFGIKGYNLERKKIALKDVGGPIEIIARGHSPDESRLLALQTAEIFIKRHESMLAPTQQKIEALQEKLSLFHDRIAQIEKKLSRISSDQSPVYATLIHLRAQYEIALHHEPIVQVQSARIVGEPLLSPKWVKPRIILTLVGGGMIGALIGFFLVYFKEKVMKA